MPKPKPPLKRALKSTWISVHKREIDVPLLSRVGAILSHPSLFRRFLRQSLSRERIAGRSAADDILAVLENP